MRNLSKPLGYHSDVHGWRFIKIQFFRFLFPLPMERLNTSIDMSKKNIKTHPATK